MEKRLPLALALSIAFVVVTQVMFAPPPGERGDAAGSDDATQSGPVEPSGPPGEGGPGAAPSSSTPSGPVSAPSSRSIASAEQDASAPLVTQTLVGNRLSTEWTSRGAALSRFTLLDFHPTIENDEPLVLLDRLDNEHANLTLRDVAGAYGLDEVNWRVEPTDDGVTFTYRAADGLVFVRRASLSDAPYSLDLELEVRNEGTSRVDSLSLTLQGARGVLDQDSSSRFYGRPTAIAVIEDGAGQQEVVTWADDDLRGEGRTIGADERLVAAGSMTNYFASVLLPRGETDVRQVFPEPVRNLLALDLKVAAKNPIDDREAAYWRNELAGEVDDSAAADVQLLVLGLEPGQSQSYAFRFFAGPKSAELTGEDGFGFLTPLREQAYGNWAWINRALLAVLRFFESIFGNWGVAIILLTLMVRTLLFPLNRKQQTSMARYGAVMAKLKPQLDALKAKYKNNQRKYQEEQMKLLKQHGATPPLGGCLLMFLQFPVWISLFQILGTSIELRQAPFVGWVHDLSRPDALPLGIAGFETINVLPILMSAATIVQMRFQPKPADPQQQQTQKIMGMFMPLVMLWFLYGYSSGLSLYILTSSLLGIFEYRVIRRFWPIDDGSSPVEVLPAASGKGQ